jgi:hypothetical protein
LAAGLFKKFCEKEASNSSGTTSHSNFDSFVCQFNLMCYNNNKDTRARDEIRSSGLQCLSTMVQRLVPDDSLRATFLWDNMDKIVPGLLFVMHERALEEQKLNAKSGKGHHQSDDKLEEKHNLDRYLYGDFYFHIKRSQSNQNGFQQNDPNRDDIGSVDSDEVNLDTADHDNIKARYHRTNRNDDINLDQSAAVAAAEAELGTPQSSSNEGGPMYNGKNVNNIDIIDPDHEAKWLLKLLAAKADYITITKIITPVLAYLDDNSAHNGASGWEHSDFMRSIFLIIMYNVKQQHAIVIKELIKHLDSHKVSNAKLKCCIIRAISTCIRIAAMHSVGTTGQIIEIFTNLLKHLYFSVEKVFKRKTLQKSGGTFSSNSINELDEQEKLQHEIIAAMSSFTFHLPDFSKNDIVTLIARQINSQQFNYIDLAAIQNNKTSSNTQMVNMEQLNAQIRAKYFECLHEICLNYRPSQTFGAFTTITFLEDILRLTLVADWKSRCRAHEILHHLLDKHQILAKIKKLKPTLFNEKKIDSKDSKPIIKTRNQTILSQLNLRNEIVDDSQPTSSLIGGLRLITSREDVHFMRKHGTFFMAHITENLFLVNNQPSNFHSIYLTAALAIIGLFNEHEFLVELIRFAFHVQELALLNHAQKVFTFEAACMIHKFVCAIFLLLSKSSGIAGLYQYCSDMCDLRKQSHLYPFLYPEYIELNSSLYSHPSNANLDNLDRISVSSSKSSSRLNIKDKMKEDFRRQLSDAARDYSESILKPNEDDNGSEETVQNKDTISNRSSHLKNVKTFLFFIKSYNILFLNFLHFY